MFEAFEKITKKKSNIKLVVAGSNHPNFPHYLDEFIKYILPTLNSQVMSLQEKLASVFRKADVVVLPYNAAPGTSGVFHLACGYGRPIVASDLPEIREMVNDGASAILVPPGDADALKNAILKVLFDKELATKMSDQNLNFAQERKLERRGKSLRTSIPIAFTLLTL